MADNCYFRVNGLINVDYLKIDTRVDMSFKEAIKKSEKIQSTTTLYKDFQKESEITSTSMYAKYFSPEFVESNAAFNIYRKTPFQKYYNYICTLKNGDYSFIDYNVVNNQFYHYMAWIEVFNSENTTEYLCYEDKDENDNIQYLKTSFDRWSICDIEEKEEGIYEKIGNLWALGINMSDPEFSHNLSITTWDTLGKYGKISMGSKNYESSTFTGLLGDIKEYNLYDIPSHGKEVDTTIPKEYNSDGSKNINYLFYQNSVKQVYNYTEKINLENPYAREIEKLESWKEFCSNGNLKLLRDTKGSAWIVQIIDSPKNTINQGENTTISFSWQEIENVNDYSIIKIL